MNRPGFALGRFPLPIATAHVVTLLAFGCAAAQPPPCGTYRYAYPHNTDDLVENHFIVLDCSSQRPAGRYSGTSDDFDRGREGYLPAFFAAHCFAEPVPLSHPGGGDGSPPELEPWPHPFGRGSRAHEGTISPDWTFQGQPSA